MKLTISNFRRFTTSPLLISLKRGDMTLLKGKSGAGKTTILEAIRWCLYGSMKNIYPFGVTQKCYVQIEIDNQMVIYRQKHPERLVISYVTNDNNELKQHNYEDVVAQSIIDNFYGPKEVWLACSYIAQKMRCNLLNMSQTDKIEVLNKLSFHGEDPRSYIELINNKAKDLSKEYNIRQNIFNEECQKFQEHINISIPDMSYYLNDVDFDNLKQGIKSLESEIEILTQELIKQSKLQGTFNSLKERQCEIIEKIENNKNYNETGLQSLKECNLKLQKYISLLQERDNKICEYNNQLNMFMDKDNLSKGIFRLDMNLANIQTLSKDINLVSLLEIKDIIESNLNKIDIVPEDYAKALQEEAIRQEQENKIVSLGLKYNAKSLKESINKARCLLKEQELLSKNVKDRNKIIENYQNKMDEYNIRKEKFYKEAEVRHNEKVNDIRQRYNIDIQNYNKRKYEYDKLQTQHLNEYNIRKIEFDKQQKELLTQYEYRKQQHHNLNSQRRKEFLNRKKNYEDEYQRLYKSYTERKNNYDFQQQQILKDYKTRKSQMINDYQKLIDEYSILKYKLEDLKKLPIANNEDVADQMELIRKFEDSKDILECPNCHQGVRLIDGSLKIADNEIDVLNNQSKNNITIDQRILEARNYLVELQIRLKRNIEIKMLESEIRAKKVPEWSEYSKVLGQEPIIQDFKESPPDMSPFNEPEPKYTPFDERHPSLKSFVETQPKIIPYTESIPVEPTIELFNRNNIKYDESEPILKLPEEYKILAEPMPKHKIQEFKNMFDQLQNIKYYDEIKPSSKEIKIQLDLENNLKIIQNIIQNLYVIINKLNQEKDLYKSYIQVFNVNCNLNQEPTNQTLEYLNNLIQDYRVRLEQIQIWNKELADINIHLSKIKIDENLDYRLNEKKILYQQNSEQYSKSEIARTFNQMQNKLEIDRNNLLLLHSRLTSAEKLRIIAVKLESQFLESTLESVNQALQEILPNIFDDPINVRLSLYKETKSTKKTRIFFNLVINYRGTTYDSISQLSGGEGDRVSLAIILALNRVNNSPFLLLDECISSLEGELKERCINMIQASIPSTKAVISVSHDCVEGYYDNIIEVN